MKTRILTGKDVAMLLNMEHMLQDVENAYRSFAKGEAIQPQIQTIDIPGKNGEVDVKSCYLSTTEMTCVKAAPGYWDNQRLYGLPGIFAVVTLFDGNNGYPLCIMDGSQITGYRTGAAGGVAVRTFARPESKAIGIIGAGEQARMQLRAVHVTMPGIQKCRVWNRDMERAEQYREEMQSELGMEIQVCAEPEEVCRNSDVIVTVTPSRVPIVMADWVQPGTHICAIGADGPGKQELDPKIFAKSRCFVDSLSQCVVNGETANPIREGIITERTVAGEIGDVLLGRIKGRTSKDEISIFDATGMSVLDNAAAAGLYRRAAECGIGLEIELME